MSDLCHGTWLEAGISPGASAIFCGSSSVICCSRPPEVQEAHALTGEMDYYLKVVTPDLKVLSRFVNEELLPHDSVQHVKTAIVLETLKETGALPL